LIRDIPGGITLDILASAGASVSKVRGIHGGALKVAVRSPPENGRANAEIEAVLAKFFVVSKKQVAIVAGHASRNKRAQIMGVDSAAAQTRIREK
jgi:uncharacterized protein